AGPWVEPLSATTMRRTGGRGTPASTSGRAPSSLSAGITASTRGKPVYTDRFYAMLLRSARRPLPKDETMSLRTARPWILAASLAILATPVMPATPETPYHRVELKPAKGAALPYTLEVPQDWQVRQVAGSPGLWIGPADVQ